MAAGLENKDLRRVQHHGQNLTPLPLSTLLPGTSWGEGILWMYVAGVNGLTLMGAVRHLWPWPSSDTALVFASGARFGVDTGPAVGDSSDCTGRGRIINIPSISFVSCKRPSYCASSKA